MYYIYIDLLHSDLHSLCFVNIQYGMSSQFLFLEPYGKYSPMINANQRLKCRFSAVKFSERLLGGFVDVSIAEREQLI